MPHRNVVPKPVQRPHPPIWVACTNRDTVRLAARLGIGGLTFAFMNASEAKYWVDEYYETFRTECTPIGQDVNPNIAMLAGVMCHPDRERAIERGLEGQQFFKWALAHYYRFGEHRPGRTDLWAEFQRSEREPMAGTDGVGDPEQVRRHFRELEDAGVDQLILLQQCGNYQHDEICDSLELLGRDVLPEFIERDVEAVRRKTEELAPHVERARAAVPEIAASPTDAVESYQRAWASAGLRPGELGAQRALDASGLWRLHIGGAQGRRDDARG
jgi:hypothetical protein